MNKLYLDFETYSTVPIKYGHNAYAEEAEWLLLAYAWNDNPVYVWDCTATEMPYVLYEYIHRKDKIVVAHNASFDRKMLELKIKEPLVWYDTMIQAYRASLPGSLGKLCEIFKLPVDTAKDKRGSYLINLFCKPLGKNRKLDRATRETHPVEWKEFIEYAKLDIISMRELHKLMPKWNDSEIEDYYLELDHRINNRGFKVDLDLTRAAIELADICKKRNNAKTFKATKGDVKAASQRDALLYHILNSYGIKLKNLQAGTINSLLNNEALDMGIKDLLRLRIASTKSSTSKFKTLQKATSYDGRLRGTLQAYGASRTGRWAGRIFQPHNLPRPDRKFKKTIDEGIDNIKAGIADLIYDNVESLLSSSLRGVIQAEQGNKLVVSDYSSIEGRVLAWLAGEHWKLDAYTDHDLGIGYDMYVNTYSKTFGIEPSEVTDTQRQLGKVLELGLGYGGGVGAFITFAKAYNVDLHELTHIELPDHIEYSASQWYEKAKELKRTMGLEREVFIACDGIKRLWRESNEAIVNFWYELESAFRAAIYGETTKTRYYTIDRQGKWVRIKLPSGRYMCYPGARIEDKKLKYLGINQYTRQWCLLDTYGGKLAENITQAVSRDILANGIAKAEEGGYPVILTVHDEELTEVPDKPQYNEKELSKLMCTLPEWAKGLPIAAKGFEAYRYRKD